jgi:hypothetical protein
MAVTSSDRRRRVPQAWLPLALLAAVLVAPGLASADTTYAVLFSGGGDKDSNKQRYYDQSLRMWNDASGLFTPANTWLLFADGTEVGDDRRDATDMAGTYVDSDWSMIPFGHILSATEANLALIMAGVGQVITSEDSFYFWSFDHGAPLAGANPGNDSALVTWEPATTADYVSDQELADMANGFLNEPKGSAYAFAQCHAGGMVDELMAGPAPGRRFAAWAADASECSLGDGWASKWADAVENPTLRLSTHAMGEFARINDPFGPGGTSQETPGWTGANFDFITNNPIPEPASVLLLSSGLVGLVAWRRKRTTAR